MIAMMAMIALITMITMIALMPPDSHDCLDHFTNLFVKILLMELLINIVL